MANRMKNTCSLYLCLLLSLYCTNRYNQVSGFSSFRFSRLSRPVKNGFINGNVGANADANANADADANKMRFVRDTKTQRFSSGDVDLESVESEGNTETVDNSKAPQAVATGYSQNPDLLLAIEEAAVSALASLPTMDSDGNNDMKIDLATVYVSSIYDGQYSPTKVVPAIVDFCKENDRTVQKLIGCYAGGLIGTRGATSGSGSGNNPKVSTVESEGLAAVTISFMVLPSTDIQTFHLMEDDVPDPSDGTVSPNQWKQWAGMSHLKGDAQSKASITSAESLSLNTNEEEDVYGNPYSFMLLPAPSFQKELDDFLRGLSMTFGKQTTTFGALSSTVSSLSRAKLFRYDVDRLNEDNTLTEGCVGVSMRGDAKWNVMVAQGSKPVGGVYRVVAGEQSTIGAIQLDEVATEQLRAAEEESDLVDSDEDEDEEDEQQDGQNTDVKKQMAAAYAKAAIPKPVLAECNYLMKSLSDDDQAYMRKFILVGLERSGGGLGRSPSELIRLSQGLGHRYRVHQVASAGMKDGSVTLPLGSVDVELGTRMRFFVRDGEFAKKEVEAIWMGYKKKELENTFSSGPIETEAFNPAGCLVFPTLDRGEKLFGGKAGFESGAIAEYVPSVPSIGGFFTNGVIASLDENDGEVMVHGSASCYALVGSKSNRPVYSAAKAQADTLQKEKQKSDAEEAERAAEAEEVNRAKDTNLDDVDEDDAPAPRSEDGELITKRREVHSGRALTVSAVQWSVAENIAKPSSALEGFMWDKETEVDRFRERVPLMNLVSQCRLADLDPSKPKPRDWLKPVRAAVEENGFVVIPEIKRLEPLRGSVRKRYDVKKLTKQVVSAGVPAFGINCDQVMFGGSLDDITECREAVSTSILEASNAEDGVIAPPILASDLILYPYQLYKLRLAGADATNLIVGALTTKDLLYLSKIAASLKMSIVASVTSEVQIKAIATLDGIGAISISNRDLETFGVDETGAQALNLLRSEALKEFKEQHPDAIVFVEGGVGRIEMEGDGEVKGETYIQALKDAGAMGAIIGGINWADWC